jgi:RNAse (barnase) inhibitor barstar
MIEVPKTTEVLEHSHLLDFLYDIIVPKVEGPIEIVLEEVADQIESDNQQEEERSGVDSSYVKQLLNVTWNIVSQLKIAPVRLLKNISSSTAIKLKLSKLKKPDDRENEDSSTSTNKPPLVEEITIPSVTQLSKYGVSFIPTKGNISTIAFDKEKAAFHLPTISLDSNSEVMFRNLVAYEISSASGPLLFTRYIELMNGIVDTEEDARLLRESGIISNRLKSDEEVANMLNRMSNCKCIRLTKAPFLDKVIEDVNKYYDSLWMVKMKRFMKRSVFCSWQYLTLLAAILLFLLMAMEVFCSFYQCARIFHVDIFNTTSS